MAQSAPCRLVAASGLASSAVPLRCCFSVITFCHFPNLSASASLCPSYRFCLRSFISFASGSAPILLSAPFLHSQAPKLPSSCGFFKLLGFPFSLLLPARTHKSLMSLCHQKSVHFLISGFGKARSAKEQFWNNYSLM